jgi:uncharacterized membrane protein YozB (DUF420 family)
VQIPHHRPIACVSYGVALVLLIAGLALEFDRHQTLGPLVAICGVLLTVTTLVLEKRHDAQGWRW